jgi:putative ABC transport system permease protein
VTIEAPDRNRVALLKVVGKLAPGVSLEGAHAQLETLRKRTALQHPRYPGNRMRLQLSPLQDRLVAGSDVALGILLGAVACVLLIACANIANLLLGRSSARYREIAIRAAVGAGRARILRQLMVEGLLFAVIGSAAGLLLARWALDAIIGLLPYALPRLAESTIDHRVLTYTLLATCVTAFVFGLAPALAMFRTNVHEALRDASRGAAGRPTSPRIGRVLVAVQLALAVVLLTGAGLLVKSFLQMHAHPPGFDPAQVLVLKVQLSGPKYGPETAQHAYVDEFLRRAQTIPGVVAASLSTHGDHITVARREGAPPLPPDELMQRSVLVNSTSAAFPRAIGLRVLHGRWFTDFESSAVVVNESLARREFGAGQAVGQRLRLGDPDGPLSTVVGVASDMRYSTLDAEPPPEVYVHYSHEGLFRFTAVVRTAGDPLSAAPIVQKLTADIDRTLPVFDVMTLEQALSDSIGPRRFNLLLFGSFAGAALLLALVGIYGVMSYTVMQRTHEIGVRMALGAERWRVLRMVLRQGMVMAVAGVAVGTAAAPLTTRVMSTLLYRVEPADPVILLGVSAALCVTALAACIGPARKAALVDPLVAMRAE